MSVASLKPTAIQTNGTYQSAYSDYFEAHSDAKPFVLDAEFLANFRTKKPKFGFNGLGEFVFYRTYSRLKDDGSKETFQDTLQRVVEGCYEVQRRHCRRLHIPWDYSKAVLSAHEMFQRMWDFKFLPPGRGLWMMGTPFMYERGGTALHNCAYVSSDVGTESDPSQPFCFVMDMSMLGVGVGFDTKGAGRIKIQAPAAYETTFVIPDSREGWVESVRHLIHSYTIKPELGHLVFDYSQIRKKGTPIKGFGGLASGSEVLERLHGMTKDLLDCRIDQVLSSVDIVDLMNYIGVCVVAGNVRRTSELALGEFDDSDYRRMKDYKLHEKEMRSHRWASNNSLFATVGANYEQVAEQINLNGEPGLVWLDNMRDFGRMIDGRKPGIDGRVAGTNPCAEMCLESHELCTLVEVFPANHNDSHDYLRTLKFAYLYGKTVTLMPTHNPRTNQVMLRNRRIGLSHSGIVQAFAKFGRRAVLTDFCDAGYNEIRRWDDIYSEWLCVPKSIKCTTVKPSGSVSLLCGATPGIHYPEARSYWRRVRLSKDSVLVGLLRKAGYHIEQSITDNKTCVVKFAVTDESIRATNEVGIWEQVRNVVDYQRYWSDNSVSCTIKFKPEESREIANVIAAFEDELKSISFLPLEDHGYEQAPYEPCTKEEAEAYNAKLLPVDYTSYINEAMGVKYCDGDKCQI